MGVSIGTGYGGDTKQALAEALGALDPMVDSESLQLILVFASRIYDPYVLASYLSDRFFGVPVVGASTSGELSPAGYTSHSLVVAVFYDMPYRFGVAGIREIGGDPRAAGFLTAKRAYQAITDHGPFATLLLLTDGLSPRQSEIIHGAFQFAGADIPIVGGAAADDRTLHQTFLIMGPHVYHHGVVGVWIEGQTPVGAAIEHGWESLGDFMRVTSADGSVIEQLDGQPALERYLQSMGLPLDASHDTRVSTLGIVHPLGIVSSDMPFQVRHVLKEQGTALVCFGDVPRSSLVSVMTATPEQLLTSSEHGARLAMGRAGNPHVAIIFSCVARAAALGDRVRDEALAIGRGVGNLPVLGFYTYGEFARLPGRVGFYNGSLVAMVL